MNQPVFSQFCCRVRTFAGPDALEQIPGVLSFLQVNKPFIITDSGVRSAGLLDPVESVLGTRYKARGIFSEVPPDSDLSLISTIAAQYKDLHCDSIIAVGGGSVIDTAKAVNLLVSEQSENLMEFAGAGKIKRALRPLLVIPTTSGTGSEATLVAVIRDKISGRKLLFTSHFLLPHAAFLDPVMTLTLPPTISASTGMDALTHAIEAYTGLAKNPLSDSYALKAIEILAKNLLSVVKEPNQPEKRLALAVASNLAGTAFSNSMVGMVHSIGHSVGAVCHIPHGTCMSILLPYGLEYNMHKAEQTIAQLLLPLTDSQMYTETPPELRAQAVVTAIRNLNNDLNIATKGAHVTRFRDFFNKEGELVMRPEHFKRIAETAIHDGSIFYNQEELDREDVRMVLEAAYWGYPLDKTLVKKG